MQKPNANHTGWALPRRSTRYQVIPTTTMRRPLRLLGRRSHAITPAAVKEAPTGCTASHSHSGSGWLWSDTSTPTSAARPPASTAAIAAATEAVSQGDGRPTCDRPGSFPIEHQALDGTVASGAPLL